MYVITMVLADNLIVYPGIKLNMWFLPILQHLAKLYLSSSCATINFKNKGLNIVFECQLH